MFNNFFQLFLHVIFKLIAIIKMSYSTERKSNPKKKVKKYINTGYFDSHLSEISNALYKKSIFSKHLFCYLNDKHFPNIIKSFIQRNKSFIEEVNRNKNSTNEVNSYILNDHKEAQFNVDIINLLKSLYTLKKSMSPELEEIKDVNNSIVTSFKKYKKRNIQLKKIRDKQVLENLAVKYNSERSFSFDINVDIYKDSPLTTKNLEKLMFYYIINRERNGNDENNKNNEKSITYKKLDPVVWKEQKMNNLKEIKFLDKINRITEKKIVKGNYVGNDNDLIDEEEIKLLEQQNIDIDQYIANKRKIKLRKERRKLKLDIENDKKEIITLKKTIKDTLSRNNRLKGFSTLKLYDSTTPSLKLNSPEQLNFRGQTFYSNNNKKIPEVIKNVKYFNSTLNKDGIFKSSSYQTFKDFNKTKNSSLYSNKTTSNIFQQSTYYSNSTKNKTNFEQIKFNNTNTITPSNSITNTRRTNKQNTTNLKIFKNNLKLKNINFNDKGKKRKTFIRNKCNTFLEDFYKNDTDNIYSVCKKLDDKNESQNKEEYLLMINKYLKSKNYNISNNKKNNMKDTIIFFNNLKNRIINQVDRLSFRKLKHLYKDDAKKFLKYADIIDLNFVNIENELLTKVLQKK